MRGDAITRNVQAQQTVAISPTTTRRRMKLSALNQIQRLVANSNKRARKFDR
jgi:hypothetical protein